MIHSLNGTVLSKTPGSLVMQCGGIGFYVQFPVVDYADLPEVGESGVIYTHFSVKQDGMELFGFASERQRSVFRLLIGVSGVGARVALSILSVYDGDAVAMAVAAGDYKALTACPGVGAKLAQRIVLELKDKVGAFGAPESMGLQAVSATAGGTTGVAVAALVSLGFAQSEAASAVAKLPPETSLEQMIGAALRALGSR